MDLKLSISADFKAASESFKELANSSEETRQKIEKFSEAFQDKHIDSFIDKQKLLEASMKGTRGETDAAKAASNNYQKEIERLIRSGLDPESSAIQRLVTEQNKLKDKVKEATEVQKAQEDVMKGAEKAALGMLAAIGAAAAALGVAAQKTAEAGDQYAKTARIIGMTAEQFQELDYAAKMSGVDNLKGSLERLNKSVSDVKSGTGSLTSYLKENDTQLLNQLDNVKSNEEAFMLLMDAIGKAPDEFSRAELATAAFGKSGQELILMAEAGAEGIADLREEARKYGVISNEAAAQSEEYLDAQARLKAAITGVSTELTSGLLPSLTGIINGFADFIAGIDDWEGKLTIIGYALAGVTAGLIAFLVVAKGAAVVQALSAAFQGLTAAIAANPIGAIAVVITAVLIPALIALYKNWDTVQTYLQQGLARVQFAFKWLGSVIEEGLVVAFNTVKAAGATLVDFILGNILRGIGKMLEVMGQLPFVGEMFQAASAKVNGLGNAIGNIAEETRRSSAAAIAAAHAKQDATEAELKNTLASIDTESRARRAAIEEQKKENAETIANEEETQAQITEIKKQALEDQNRTLQERLAEIPLSEAAIQSQQMEQFTSYLNQRMELEQLDNDERIEWLKEQQAMLMESDIINGEEKVALTKAMNDKIKEEDEKLKNAKLKIMSQQLGAANTFFKGMEDMASLASEKSIGLAILEKAMAVAQAGINSALAFTKTLSEVPYPYNFIAAAGVLATGLAQQVKIISTPLPSAETGGRFIVPNAVGSDSQLMRVNPGEEVDITPRGMVGESGQQNIIVQIDRDVIFDVVNDGIRSGDILLAAVNY